MIQPQPAAGACLIECGTERAGQSVGGMRQLVIQVDEEVEAVLVRELVVEFYRIHIAIEFLRADYLKIVELAGQRRGRNKLQHLLRYLAKPVLRDDVAR